MTKKARKTKKKNFIYAIGRRRTASARIRLFKGKEPNLVNNIPVEDYFSEKTLIAFWQKPFILTETLGKYYFTAKVRSGGKKGQLDALVHGLARALEKTNPEKFRTLLKKGGLLTRDARIRERRKIGMGGKSRRKKQSPKR